MKYLWNGIIGFCLAMSILSCVYMVGCLISGDDLDRGWFTFIYSVSLFFTLISAGRASGDMIVFESQYNKLTAYIKG